MKHNLNQVRNFVRDLFENEEKYREKMISDIGECSSTDISLGYMSALKAVLKFIDEEA